MSGHKSLDTPERKVSIMANVREKRKNGKVVSYQFTACLERDVRDKQIRRYTTWIPPVGLTPSKAKKAAERAADAWEQAIRAEYQKQKDALAQGRVYSLPPEMRHDGFVDFIENVWFPLEIKSGNRKPSTVAFYQNVTKHITNYFAGAVLQEISAIDIQKYLNAMWMDSGIGWDIHRTTFPLVQ